MKRIFDLVFRDLFVGDFSELLDSWALLFAIVPFGALIFCGMYVGQFVLNSMLLGIVLMFVFPLLGFALLVGIRKTLATRQDRALPAHKEAQANVEATLDSPLVVVRIEASSESGNRPKYTLRRMNALENLYVQKGFAASVYELEAEFGEQYPEVDWTRIVADPPKSLATSMQRTEGHSIEPIHTSGR